MGTINLPKSPYTLNQQKPAGDTRIPAYEELQQAVTQILEEETGKIIEYLTNKLPPEVLERLNTEGDLKEKLYNSINRYYQETISRYASSDNQDEAAVFTRRTSGEVAELLRSIGGAKFNAGEIEKAAGNKRNGDLEFHANSMLRQNTDASAFLCGDAGSIVKCIFRDNTVKPKTVTDVRLSINIPDFDLISPVFHYHAAAKYLIKDHISRNIIKSIDKAVESSGGKEAVELAGGVLAEIDAAGLSVLNTGWNTGKNEGIENIRSCGFSAAVNSLVSVLESSKLGYQVIENIRNGRELNIQEYEESDPANLPDERYRIRLRYTDRDQLAEDCAVYDTQVKGFEHDVQHLWNLIEVIYQDSKSVFKVNDFEDLARKNKSRIRDLIKPNGDGSARGEIYGEKGNVRAKLARMHERIKNMYEFLYPIERRVMEDRLEQLENECTRLDFIINPHHLQPGLLIDIEITSIKRKKTTLDSVAGALSGFLNSVYAGFRDAAVKEIINGK